MPTKYLPICFRHNTSFAVLNDCWVAGFVGVAEYSPFAAQLEKMPTMDDWGCYFRTVCYLIFGNWAIVANAIIIFVINTNRKLRAKMALLTFLAFAELVRLFQVSRINALKNIQYRYKIFFEFSTVVSLFSVPK